MLPFQGNKGAGKMASALPARMQLPSKSPRRARLHAAAGALPSNAQRVAARAAAQSGAEGAGPAGASEAQTSAAMSLAPAASPRILVVDDDADICAVIRLTLEEEGYTVTTAANGRQALDRIGEQRPDIVLLDLTMPVMNGWEFNHRLQDVAPGIPVVFMTAAFRAQAEAETHGAAGYLSKPFDVDELLAAVARFAP